MKVKIIKITNEKQNNINYGLLDAMLDAFVCLSHKNSEFSNDVISNIIETMLNKPVLNKNTETSKENVNDDKENRQDSKTSEEKIRLSSVYGYSGVETYEIFNNIIDTIKYFNIINFDTSSMDKIIEQYIKINPDVNIDTYIQKKMDVYTGVGRADLYHTYKYIKDKELLTQKKFVDSYRDFKNDITGIKIHRMKLLFDIFTFINNFYKIGSPLDLDRYIDDNSNKLLYLKSEMLDIGAIIITNYDIEKYNSIEFFIDTLQNILKHRLLKMESDFIYEQSK